MEFFWKNIQKPNKFLPWPDECLEGACQVRCVSFGVRTLSFRGCIF
jgi:hypothetical protein